MGNSLPRTKDYWAGAKHPPAAVEKAIYDKLLTAGLLF